jgi:molybdate transport system regulatory protein
MHGQAHRLAVRHKVWLEAADAFALGDGGVELLRAIGATGSIRAGARRVGWSYRHALAYLAQADTALGLPLVARARGGHERGGATLTRAGQDFLRRYTAFRARLDRTVTRLYRAAFSRRAR